MNRNFFKLLFKIKSNLVKRVINYDYPWWLMKHDGGINTKIYIYYCGGCIDEI